MTNHVRGDRASNRKTNSALTIDTFIHNRSQNSWYHIVDFADFDARIDQRLREACSHRRANVRRRDQVRLCASKPIYASLSTQAAPDTAYTPLCSRIVWGEWEVTVPSNRRNEAQLRLECLVSGTGVEVVYGKHRGVVDSCQIDIDWESGWFRRVINRRESRERFLVQDTSHACIGDHNIQTRGCPRQCCFKSC